MRFYLGVAVKEDAQLLLALSKLRSDFGVCISAYEYWTRLATRKILGSLNDMPLILDNGQIQAYRRGLLFPLEKLRSVINEVKPEFTFAPDIIGEPEKSLDSLCRFIETNDDIDLLAPLQAHNYGLLFEDKLLDEIDMLKEHGYSRFGIGKPYTIRFSRRETVQQVVPRIRDRLPYLHFMGYPLGGGISGINLLNSVDMGTFWVLKKYRVGIYKHPEQGAKLLSALMDVDLAVRELHEKKLEPAKVGVI